VTVPARRPTASRIAGVAVLVAGLTGIVAITVTAGVDGAASVVERVCGGLVLASIVTGVGGPLLKLPKRTVRRLGVALGWVPGGSLLAIGVTQLLDWSYFAINHGPRGPHSRGGVYATGVLLVLLGLFGLAVWIAGTIQVRRFPSGRPTAPRRRKPPARRR
jgi:hypothetical protein